ncbi:MAG: hypothetical protein NT067_07045 [Candidatus Diapherotrites archaeon]|nr:hypothetical protein [Candidatus Diapherotrites archaeon]
MPTATARARPTRARRPTPSLIAKLDPVRPKVRLPSGKLVSLESAFVREGQIPEGMDVARAKRLGTKFLSSAWYDGAKAKGFKTRLSLPTYAQRVRGGRLPKADLALIHGQVDFAISLFAGNLPAERQAQLASQVRNKVTGRILSVNIAVREKARTDPRQIWEDGKELKTFFKEEGAGYTGLMKETDGRQYFAKGFSSQPTARSGPLHETVHALWKLGVIKIDVPFAQAVDRLYALEKGHIKPNPFMRTPTKEEFDRKPSWDKELKTFNEPNWATDIGNRIAQWAFQAIPESRRRWDYLYQRCMGATHANAMRAIGLRV